MANKAKRDHFKIFTFVAGFFFVALAVIEVINGIIDIFAPTILAALAGTGVSFEFSAISIISLLINMVAPLCFAAFAILAAILLIIKKDSVAAFIPMGMLTFVFFRNVFSTLMAPIVSTFIARLGAEAIYIYYSYIASLVSLVVGFFCALVLTVVLCIAACTFLKKHRFVLGFILTVVVILGAVIGTLSSGFSAFLMVFNYLFAGMPMQVVMINFYSMLIAPIILAVKRFALIIPMLLASVGMITLGKKNEPEIADETEGEAVVEEEQIPESQEKQ